MKIDGFDIKNQYGVYPTSDMEYAILPELRQYMQELNTSGSVYYGTVHGVRSFSIPCFILGSDYMEKIDQFKRLFLDENGDQKEVYIEFDAWSNRRLKVFLQSTISITKRSHNAAEFEFSITAASPYYESANSIEKYFDALSLPQEIPIEYYGTKSTGFTITVSGTAGSFTIKTVQKDGSESTFSYDSSSHDTYMTIDFINFTIDDNGSNGLMNSSGDFLQLNINTSKVVIDGDVSGSLNLSYRERYV
ncbi:hypothetical protein [Salibacterium lacus]|uniref:Phage tail protein n=1 Tax=Salibacterium lacus TaxID=1898109 RepID=A0ABW5T0E7_9BACI